MRIISGTARGTKLYTLEGEHTRPTLDRVKESLFNIIQNDIEDKVVLDLFSGSGAIGLEFASRGAREVYLNDNSKEALEIIKQNIEKTHLSEKIKLYNLNYLKLIQNLNRSNFDIVYLDPPYKTDYIIRALKELLKFKIITEESLIIAETDDKEKILEQIQELKKFKILDERKYGRTYIIFLKIFNRKEE